MTVVSLTSGAPPELALSFYDGEHLRIEVARNDLPGVLVLTIDASVGGRSTSSEAIRQFEPDEADVFDLTPAELDVFVENQRYFYNIWRYVEDRWVLAVKGNFSKLNAIRPVLTTPPPAPPVNQALPGIAGTGLVGSLHTVTPAGWDAFDEVNTSWLDGQTLEPIPGATATSIIPGIADLPSIRVRQQARRSGGPWSAWAVSAEFALSVPNSPPVGGDVTVEFLVLAPPVVVEPPPEPLAVAIGDDGVSWSGVGPGSVEVTENGVMWNA